MNCRFHKENPIPCSICMKAEIEACKKDLTHKHDLTEIEKQYETICKAK